MKTHGKGFFFLSVTLGFSFVISVCLLASPKWAAGQAKLRFATDRNSKGELAAYDKIIKAFVEKNPGTSIEVEPVSWKDQRTYLISAIASNTVPDLYNSSYVQLLNHATLGNILPVDDLINDIGRQNFFEELLEQGFFKGHYWGVPWTSEGTCFWYRKDLFAEKGLKVPETWEQLLECAKALTIDRNGDGRPDIYGMVVPYGKGNMTAKIFHAFLISNGGYLFNKDLVPAVDSKESAETLEYLKQLSKYSPPDSSQFDFSETLMTFVTGNAAMTYYFGRTLSKTAESNPGIIDKIGTFMIKRKTYVAHTVVENMVIPKGAKYPDIAKKFIKYFLTDRDGYMDIMRSVPGHFYPSLKASASSQEYLSQPLLKSHQDISEVLKAAHLVAASPCYEHKGVPNPYVDIIENTGVTNDIMQRGLLKGEPAGEALKWGQQKMNELLKEAKKTEG